MSWGFLFSLAVFIVGIAVAFLCGDTYMERLSDHRGLLLVPVDDTIPTKLTSRPRHTVVVVIDGLSAVDAVTLPVMQRLCAEHPCASTDVGAITFSRPAYASISTGLESDRTGSRTNADADALAAESIWEVAREDLRVVSATTEEPWWRELFPKGFDRYVLSKRSDDVFLAEPTELTLIHPMYVDDAAHEHGVDSTGYRDALARTDRELQGLVDRLDFRRDLLVVTADHGHVPRGGHGGRQARVAYTTTCFAGFGVRADARIERMSVTAIAPSIALLSGLRFPKHMRASEDHADDLDAVMSLADPAAYPTDYLADRRAAIERFRAANARALRAWGFSSTWRSAYEQGSRRHLIRLIVTFVAFLVVLLVFGRSWRFGRSSTVQPARARRSPLPTSTLFAVALSLLTIAALRVVYGCFDFSAVNGTAEFVRDTLVTSLVCTAAMMVAHAVIVRSHAALVVDLALACALTTVANLSQPLLAGPAVGFPLPPAPWLFLPLPLSMILLVQATLGVLSMAALWLRARRSTPA